MLTEADQLKGPALIPGHDTILVLGARGHGATGNVPYGHLAQLHMFHIKCC